MKKNGCKKSWINSEPDSWLAQSVPFNSSVVEVLRLVHHLLESHLHRLQLHRLQFNFLALAILLVAPMAALCEQAPPSSGLLPPPQDLTIFKKPFDSLTRRNQWQVMIHGLRNAPLDPTVWGARLVDRSENRQLIPMRPFFLRHSEKGDYQVESIAMNFRFRQIGDGMMRRRPDTYTPILELGFAGLYQKGAPGELAIIDSSYALRLTPSPLFESGMFFRSHSKYQKVAELNYLEIKAATDYQLELHFTPTTLKVLLNETQIAELAGDYRSGLLSLQTDWHPAVITDLIISGSITEEDQRVALVESGLRGNS